MGVGLGWAGMSASWESSGRLQPIAYKLSPQYSCHPLSPSMQWVRVGTHQHRQLLFHSARVHQAAAYEVPIPAVQPSPVRASVLPGQWSNQSKGFTRPAVVAVVVPDAAVDPALVRVLNAAGQVPSILQFGW